MVTHYNMFVFIMSFIMMMGGVLLTALSYRPKEMREEWWEWTERFYKSETSRVAGPLLIVISVVINLAVVSHCLLKRRAKHKEDESTDIKATNFRKGDIKSWQIERKGLIFPDSDIACFPDGSLRYVR